MKIRTRHDQAIACVLIPSAGRPGVLHTTLTEQRFLDRRSTFVGLQNDQWGDYKQVRRDFSSITYIRYDNPGGSTVVARERLRAHATSLDEFRRYVCADDNTYYTEASLTNLVRASLSFKQLTVVGGMQGSTSMNAKPSRFDEAYVKKSGFTKSGLRFYKKIGMMFWCFPHSLYSKIKYLEDWGDLRSAGCMEDHSIALACLKKGHTRFVVCMNAPFKKKRFQPGGQGDPRSRATKIGLAWIRLGALYPEYMSHVRMIWPYAKFYDIAKKAQDEDIPF